MTNVGQPSHWLHFESTNQNGTNGGCPRGALRIAHFAQCLRTREPRGPRVLQADSSGLATSRPVCSTMPMAYGSTTPRTDAVIHSDFDATIDTAREFDTSRWPHFRRSAQLAAVGVAMVGATAVLRGSMMRMTADPSDGQVNLDGLSFMPVVSTLYRALFGRGTAVFFTAQRTPC
jgi:hypothetical protein